MMTQEEYVNGVLALVRQGKTIKEIGQELGYHPATVSKWLKSGGPPPARAVEASERVVDERWARRIQELLRPPAEKLLATSVYEIIKAEGFTGSYNTVARHLRDLRGPRFRAVPALSVPIETAPGEEAQFDWSECSDWTERWGLGQVFCFGAILCWSRWKTWWFTTSLDAEHTFEGLVRFFEAAGGTPKVARTDRMGALGRSRGKRFSLHRPAIAFARHHNLELKACQAGDAKRKGKCERPFRDLKETFLTELDATGVPGSVGELTRRAEAFLAGRVHPRPHSTTGEPPERRLEVEQRFLSALSPRRFDTAYVEDRRVHPRLPLVEWAGVAYSVPPEVLGAKLTCRVEVDSDVLEISWGGTVVARHRLCPGATEAVWDPAHHQDAQAIALGRSRPMLRRLETLAPERSSSAGRLELGEGDYEVEAIDLARRYGGCECTGAGK